MSTYILLNINQFYAVPRTQHGGRRKLSVKTLRSLVSAEFRSVLIGGIKLRALPRHQREEMKIPNLLNLLNIKFKF